MTSLSAAKVRQYCKGKDFVAIDDIIRYQKIIPKSVYRKTVAEMLTSIGYTYVGRKRVGGRIKHCWRKQNDKSKLELEVLRLERLDQRQSRDIKTTKELLNLGFTREQALGYLRMLYNSDMEQADIVADEEREAQIFARKVEEIINATFKVSQMIHACCFVFYVEKYFPGLMSENMYQNMLRQVYSVLGYSRDDDERILEWLALKEIPHFLDTLSKIPDEADYGEFKKFMVEAFLTSETVDILFPNGVDYLELAAICYLARSINQGKEHKQPYGLTDVQYERSVKHLQKIKRNYERQQI
ncbi:MAG: hypothetical protein QNJ16_19690 [Rhodobacter sp.]|nr:hypothetical protein [Rhodobacter sp.]